MYGLMFDFLGQYANQSDGAGGGPSPADKLYFPVNCYPDSEFYQQAQALAEKRELPLSELLRDLGRFIAPRLLEYYRGLGGTEAQSSFEILEQADERMHQMVRDQCPEASPPLVSSYRESSNVLVMHYQSERMLCHLARGIILGMGECFGETLKIDETQCIHHGAQDCVFRIQR